MFSSFIYILSSFILLDYGKEKYAELLILRNYLYIIQGYCLQNEPAPSDSSALSRNQNQTNKAKGGANNLVINHHKSKMMCPSDGAAGLSNLTNAFFSQQISALFLPQWKGKWVSVLQEIFYLVLNKRFHWPAAGEYVIKASGEIEVGSSGSAGSGVTLWSKATQRFSVCVCD